MNFAQYQGLDLPVFDAEEQLYHLKPKMHEIAAAPTPTILRRVDCYGPDNMSVMQRINTAEHGFKTIAELCGACVIPHQFGLYPVADRLQLLQYQDKRILPPGYLLAARVAVIKDIELTAEPNFSLLSHKRQRHLVWPVLRGIVKYYNQKGSLLDMKGDQFTYGRLPSKNTKEWILHDIEPRVRKHNDPNSRKFTRQ